MGPPLVKGHFFIENPETSLLCLLSGKGKLEIMCFIVQLVKRDYTALSSVSFVVVICSRLEFLFRWCFPCFISDSFLCSLNYPLTSLIVLAPCGYLPSALTDLYLIPVISPQHTKYLFLFFFCLGQIILFYPLVYVLVVLPGGIFSVSSGLQFCICLILSRNGSFLKFSPPVCIQVQPFIFDDICCVLKRRWVV